MTLRITIEEIVLGNEAVKNLLHVVNVDNISRKKGYDTTGGEHLYRVRSGTKEVEVKHMRAQGAVVLARKALAALTANVSVDKV